MNWLDLSQYILSGVGIVAIISYGYGQVMQGRNQSKLDTIAILQEDVTVLRGKVEELTEKVVKLTEEIAQKDKKLAEVIDILQGKDPVMQDFIKESTPIIKKLDLYLNAQKF